MKRAYFIAGPIVLALLCAPGAGGNQSKTLASAVNQQRLLYVAVPGVRDYLEYGGHGLLVFDIDNGHKFVKRIPTAGFNENGKPRNVKGVCASADTKRIYISTTHTLQCLDLVSERILWERAYEDGCDRMAIAPNDSASLQ
jgi:hypothetical protein